MASKVEICKVALARVAGDISIVSLNDGTAESKLCSILYPTTVDSVIIAGSWASCVRRAKLARLAEAPAFGYLYKYQLPTDPLCLKVLDLNGYYPDEDMYAIEGNTLLTDAETCSIRYLARLTDPEAFGPYLTQAIISKLTADLAYNITGKSSVAERAYMKYEKEKENWLGQDGQQGSNQRTYAQELIQVR